MISRAAMLRGTLRCTRPFGTLVATEEFPLNVTLTPQKDKAPAVSTSKLENGVSVLSKDCTSSVVSLKVAVMSGSSAEAADQRGAAQLLAAAAFAGSGESTGLRVVRDLESVGATFSAYADKEKIVYDVKTLADTVEPVLETVLSAIASAPRAAYVLEESKETAQLGYNAFATDTTAQLQELVCEAAYGETSPLGASMFAANLRKLSVPSVLAYRAAHFVRSNVVVAASGGISHSALTSLVEKYSAAIPAASGAAPTSTASSSSEYLGGDVKVRTDSDGISNIAIAFPVPAGDAAKPYIILKALIAAHLQKQGVCALPFLCQFKSGGILGIQASGNAAFATSVLEGAVSEIKAVAAKAPTTEADALKRKETLSSFVSSEGSSGAGSLLDAFTLGASLDTGADLRDVSADSVKAAATAVLKSTPTYAVLGATAGTPSHSTVCSWLK